MKQEFIFKNFNMGIELEIAGEFIYNGIQEINRTRVIFNNGPTFVALYDMAVGIERLEKITYVLLKYDENMNQTEFEESLITHSHTGLRDQLMKVAKNTKYEKYVKLNTCENDFMLLLQKFYKTARYERFLTDGNASLEIELFEKFLEKYTNCQKDLTFNKGIIVTEEIKSIIGKTLGGISKKYYSLIYQWCLDNNFYTYDINAFSKASRIFRGKFHKNSLIEEQLNERVALKELLIFFRKYRGKNAFFEYVDNIPQLDIDPGLVCDFFEDIANGIIPEMLVDEIEELYAENGYSIDRVRLVDLFGNPDVQYDWPMVQQCKEIICSIVAERVIPNDAVEKLEQNIEYLDDEDMAECIAEIVSVLKVYYEEKCQIEDCIAKINQSVESFCPGFISDSAKNE